MKDYRSSHLVDYEQPAHVGFVVLPVLHYLWGCVWDQLALNFVHSLKPSCIRVVTGEEKCDAVLGRVTVYITSTGCIRSIVQETTVSLDGGYQHGHDLMCAAARNGINLRSIP